MSLKPSAVKAYADHAVQTTFSPPPSPSRSVAPDGLCLDFQPQPSSFTEDYSSLNNSRCLIENDSAYNASPTSCSSNPARSITTARRVFKPQQLSAQFPSQLPRADTQRTASLPETISLYSAKSQIDSASHRIVSMPEHLRSLAHTKEFKIYSSDYNDISASTIDSIISGDGNHSRTAVSLAHVPRTPSPPSSPESIVIIENKYQLSETFLRNNHVITELKDSGREGWVTWASSPPRPIPALHGPLSLPYARCPSGAEGTVIEEQDNLPRMIWGLSGDHPGTAEDAPYTTPYRESAFHPNIPPRLQKQCDTVRKPVIPSGTTRAPAQPEYQPHIRLLSAPVDREFEYPAQFNETIDLSRLLSQSRLQDSSNLLHPTSHTSISRGHMHHPHDEKRGYDMLENQQSQWQSLLVRERLPNSTLSSNTASRSEGLVTHSKPLVCTQLAAGSSRPVILLDSQPNSMSLPPPRRLSAIEIAQKFRQQQTLLPTPPNSTSPQWSSDFSPYQDSILPSEAVFLSSLSPNIQQDIAHHLRRSVYERVTNSINDAYLAPAAHIQLNVNTQVNGNYSQGVQKFTRSHQSYPQSGNVPASPLYDAAHSPRPPPNTPLPPIPTSRKSDSNHGRPQSSVETVTAPSLASPSQIRLPQQPRSIPLTRLVQRRLSAVPEAPEESSGVTSGGMIQRSPSPPAFQQNFHLSRTAAPNPRLIPPHTESSSHRRSVHYQQIADRPAIKMLGKDLGPVHGDEASRLSAIDQIKAQLYGSDYVEIRDSNNQLEGPMTESKAQRSFVTERENGIKARNLGPKGQTPSIRRKMRGKKKHGSAGRDMPIAT